MAISFVFKFQSVSILYAPNDPTIEIRGYLADSEGTPFVDVNTGGVDYFDTSFLKSRLPASGYESFMSIAIGRSIKDKYGKTKGAVLLSGSPLLSGIEDTSDLVPGLYAVGSGIVTDTVLESVKGPNEVKLSSAATLTGDSTIVFSTAGWIIDFSELGRITEVINFDEL